MSAFVHDGGMVGTPDAEVVPSSRPLRNPEPWPEMGALVLETRALGRELGTTVKPRVLHGTDLSIHEGEFVSLPGFSGSGKSTLLYLLGALDRPTSGQVLLDGEDVGELDDDARAELRSN